MISFELTDEQAELARSLQRYFDDHASVRRSRELMDNGGGFDRDVWLQMASELGLQGLNVPEAYGGSGYGYVELGVVLHAMGRVLYSGPFLASVVFATEAILLSGSGDGFADLLQGITNGTQIGALAVAEKSGVFKAEEIQTSAARVGEDWTLDGSKTLVLHGDVATFLVVAARTSSGVSLFVVDADAAGLSRSSLPAMDQTRSLASVELVSTPARLLGEEGGAWPVIESVLDRASVALACDALGVADESLRLSVEYAKSRHQFGRAIGSFQAIKHKFADMVVALELARSAVDYATRALDAHADDATTASTIALAQCAEASLMITGESIQIFGGIGFTWEHDAHLYFKRARADGSLIGTVEEHRERMLRSLGV